MERKRLFNPEGNDSLESREIIGGNPTNIFNLNNVKYKWANGMYRRMMENFWIPEKVDLSSDNLKELDPNELNAYKGILSFLIFLDSEQTLNLPNFSDYITAPEINLILAIQTYQEAIHSQSYQYIVETLVPKSDRDAIYEFWRTDNVLLERISYIASMYQSFIDKPSTKNFNKAIIANYLLEGLYFYNGFTFFYNLASRGKVVGTSEVIRYINRDELTHVVLFQNLIRDLNLTDAEDVDWIFKMFEVAVEQEIKWSTHIIGDRVLGISKESTEQYTKYLANRRLRNIKMPEVLYPEVTENPYRHLEKMADTIGKGDVKSNVFESTVTSYNQSSAIKGWDKI